MSGGRGIQHPRPSLARRARRAGCWARHSRVAAGSRPPPHDSLMISTAGASTGLRIGTAGWGLPRAWRGEFPIGGSYLERYAARFAAVEINSSFYRQHRRSVYERWAAVVRRDRSADGAFYYSVRTTGVYCRPSCAARLARRENVRFHSSREEAERAGFRPCKRYQPDQLSLVEQTPSRSPRFAG